ncbi:glycoside hydrolase family 93 protein [Zopfia rhizophila CBS 207.26]|uniref:Glycoside hydrolase family 93 protein n=1 Tax=Zopfia rhizophila CBS 207.26 TaxID=1314779 RepID=A0A6A6EQI4_9PEZI|nr:glycoside hydrolase family 93 protein [Zopfia rhizophila CBS 207.26]
MFAFALLSGLLASAAAKSGPIDTFANVTVYQPEDEDNRVTYARTETLPDGNVIATWNDYNQINNIQIYRSQDNGFSWYPFGNATSDQEGRKLLQPHLLYLNQSFGEEWEMGTVVLAVNAMDRTSTNIEIYASGDLGETFEHVSTVATGGAPNQTNGAMPIWEPFLMLRDNKLICYYSDQRDGQHAQKLSHQTTRDGLDNWGSAVDDVVDRNYTARPGMPTVAKLPNNKWILAYEYATLNETGQYHYPIYYRISNDPENFGTERSRRLVDTVAQPYGGPYVTWTPIGGVNGTIIVSDSSTNSVYINQELGEGIWKEVRTTAARAYSRELKIRKYSLEMRGEG